MDNYKKLIKNELDLFEKELVSCFFANNFSQELFDYALQSGGKKLRPSLCFLTAKMLNNGAVSEDCFKIAKAIELIHNASLAHDDVIDEAEIRRNQTTLKANYSNKIAILAGDMILSLALKELSNIDNKEVFNLFSIIMTELCNSELKQLHWQYAKKTPTFDEYIEKSEGKTAGLFLAGMKAIAILSNATKKELTAIDDYAKNFGIAYQLEDDCADFFEKADKTTLNDLKNGIITAPVLLGDGDIERGIKKTKKLIADYSQSAIKALSGFDDNIYKDGLIELAQTIGK